MVRDLWRGGAIKETTQLLVGVGCQWFVCSQQYQHLSNPLSKQSCLKFHSFAHAVSDAVAHRSKGYYWYYNVCICHFQFVCVWSFRMRVMHLFIPLPFLLFSRTNSTRAWQGILWSPPYLTRLWCVPCTIFKRRLFRFI